MKLLSLRIALRYLTSKKSHTAVSVISFIAVCAVAVTSMAMVCIMSVFNGFENLVDSKLSQLEPQLKISPARGLAIADADSLLRVVKQIEGVEEAVPTVTENALAIYGNRQVPVTLKGIPDNYGDITGLPAAVKDDGRFLLSDGINDYAILSVGTAVALEAFPGSAQPCFLYAPKRIGAVNIANPASAFRRVPTYVSGVFEIKQGEYDQSYVYTSLDAARSLFSFTTEATALEVRLAGNVDGQAAMKTIAETLGDGYKVEDRLMQNSQSLKMINVEKWISFLLLSLILVVASFNIISTLAILILEKEKNIATLHALGADNRTVERIFVLEGWLVSVSGAVFGLVVGTALCLLQQHFGFIRLSANAENLIVDVYPVAVSVGDIVSILAIVAVVGIVASFATVRAMRGYLRR